MKKPFFFCAAVLLQVVLFSCNDGDSEDRESVSGAVGFSASSVNDASRAAVLDLDGLKTSGFLVNAYSTGVDKWASVGSSTAPEFMYKQSVEWKTSPDRWEYSPTKYWPGKVDGSDYGKLSFFAWSANAESIASVLGNDETSGTPKLSVTVPDSQGGQKDLVAGVMIDETSQTASGAVKFAFKHVLSRIGFTAKFKDAGKGVPLTVTSLKVKYAAGKVKSKATYTFGDTDGAPGGWALDATYMSNTAGDEVVAGGVPLNDDGSPERLNGVDKYLMLLPQAVDDGAIELEVSWEVGTANPKQVLTQKVILPAQTWEQGYSYDYNLVVSLVEVTFGGVTVKPWNEAGVLTLCELTYDANNGTGEKIKKMLFTGKEYPLAGNTFTRTGCDFVGWNTQADGFGANYQPAGGFTCSGDITLYAKWAKIIDLTAGVYPDGVSYAGNVITIEKKDVYKFIGSTTADRVVVASDVTCEVTLDNASVTSPVNGVSAFTLSTGANVTMRLSGTNTMNVTGGSGETGVEVVAGSTLIIESAEGDGTGTGGTLNANGKQGAGIGSRNNQTSGTIHIKGGTINVNTAWGSGIGGGFDGSNGVLIISGGNVIARSGGNGGGVYSSGAGIGGHKSVGTITITGGTVDARATNTSYAGAGIGFAAVGFGTTGTLNVSGGSVYAQGGGDAAGIGGGNGLKGITVNISGGYVEAVGGNQKDGGSRGPCIGGGNASTGMGDTNISGGFVYLNTNGNHPAIGVSGSGTSAGSISITGGTVVSSQGFIGANGTVSADENMTVGIDNLAIVFAQNVSSHATGSGTRPSFTISGKTITLTGDLTIPAGATLTVPAGWTLKLGSRAIANNGTIKCGTNTAGAGGVVEIIAGYGKIEN